MTARNLFLSIVLTTNLCWAETYVFTSFRDNGDGLHLAYSADGLHWTDSGQVFLEPQVGSKLMRDPHILHGPDGLYHMVWTTGWHDKGIGYANSADLQTWSKQHFLPLMKGTPGTRNCWAPEIFFDSNSQYYLITWSSDVEGRFPETVSADRMNNRTYFVTTKDFQTFTKPKVLFDPGFDHIDASILSYQGQYLMVIKEGDKQGKGIWGPVYLAKASNPSGPYTLIRTPAITDRAEGPALTLVNGKVTLYVDYYVSGRYGVLQSSDLKTWVNISNQASVVSGQRHGSIFSIPDDLAIALKPVPQPQPPAAALPGVNADPHIAVFGDTYYLYPTTDGTVGWMSTFFQCWSSKDLKHWINEGVILDLPRDLEWADVRAWAPAIARKHNRYYFYYSAAQCVGVAVADSPTGPFQDPLGKPLIRKRQFDAQSIDPMVFIDDDGSAYLYWGQGNCYVVKLHEDMISFPTDQVKRITPPGYNEGTMVFKRKGLYYLTWSEYDTRDPRYSVAYATGPSPLGPFIKAPDNPILRQKGLVKGAGHHSVVQIPNTDQWVIAYHRFRIPDGNGYNRETCLSPLCFDEDGRILPVDVFATVQSLD